MLSNTKAKANVRSGPTEALKSNGTLNPVHAQERAFLPLKKEPLQKKKKRKYQRHTFMHFGLWKKKKKENSLAVSTFVVFFFPFSTNVFASLFFLVHRETEANQR